VGTLAVQFARRRDAKVIGAVRGRDAVRLVKRLGVDAPLDLTNKDFAAQLRGLAPRGIDAALALAGGKALEDCLGQVNRGGRIAYPNGVEPAPRRRPGVKVVAYDAEAGPAKWAALNRAAEDTGLEVPIAAVFPLADAAKAHERLAEGHLLGRIVLRVRRGNG
jgi:NADPH:quinone reductase-like Zn-dependent oxidoreductase